MRGGIALLLLTLQVFIFPVHAFAQEVLIPDVQNLRDEIRAQADQLRAEVRGETTISDTPQTTEAPQQNPTQPSTQTQEDTPTTREESVRAFQGADRWCWEVLGGGTHDCVTISPAQGPVGTSVSVSGDSWTAGSAVTISLSPQENVVLANASVANGNFSTSIIIPAGTTEGVHDVIVKDASNQTIAQRVPFTVTAGSTQPTPTTPTPTQPVTPTPTPTTRPTVNITANPNTQEITIGTDIVITANLSGSWGNTLQYDWVLDYDNTNASCPTDREHNNVPQIVRVVPECTGTHTIIVDVSDERGNGASDLYAVIVRDSSTPTPTQPISPTPSSTQPITPTPSQPVLNPTVSLIPSSGNVGDLFIGYGQGWPANQRVDVYWGTARYSDTPTNNNGDFLVYIRVPMDATPALHLVRFTTGEIGQIITRDAIFEVRSTISPTPTITPAPMLTPTPTPSPTPQPTQPITPTPTPTIPTPTPTPSPTQPPTDPTPTNPPPTTVPELEYITVNGHAWCWPQIPVLGGLTAPSGNIENCTNVVIEYVLNGNVVRYPSIKPNEGKADPFHPGGVVQGADFQQTIPVPKWPGIVKATVTTEWYYTPPKDGTEGISASIPKPLRCTDTVYFWKDPTSNEFNIWGAFSGPRPWFRACNEIANS